ncbi:hypothetical protein FORC17_3171 [Vibrio vulnificus]|nr:hypothetical protein FORC9_3134 [Vibrio vulnificus]ANH65013.1 hypothetical protein FORC16_3130 [Vibrio vulnificus]ANN28234.1 hypothetical protein FORC17_3171 [Vibrio vulnificus]QBH28727.1 hypothetical protein FORC77_3004 [Vibrio vulnificus]
MPRSVAVSPAILQVNALILSPQILVEQILNQSTRNRTNDLTHVCRDIDCQK